MMARAVRGSIAVLLLVLAASVATAQPDPEDVEVARRLAGTLEETGELWFAAVDAAPLDTDLDAFAASLLARDDITETQVLDDAVLATTVEEITIHFSAPMPGVLGSGGMPGAAPQRLALFPGVQVGRAVAREPRCLGDLVPQGKALLIHAHHSGYADPRPQLVPLLERAGYTCELADGHLTSYLKMASAAIIFINTHGTTLPYRGADHYALASDHTEDLNVTDLAERVRSLRQGELFASREIRRDDQTKKPISVVYGTVIMDTWLERHIPAMVPNCLVLLNTCHSADLDTPWCILRDKGAGACFGYQNTTDNKWSVTWVRELLERTLGLSEERPDQAAPRLRAQCVEDAFDAIYAKPGYEAGPDWHAYDPKTTYKRAIPVLRTWWEGAGCNFSVSPHIDWALMLREDNSDDYVVSLWGAFGLADEAQVLLDEQPLDFTTHTGGGGAVFEATVPNNTTGDLVVVDRWGRRSNPVTISRFQATVSIDYDGPMCSGTMRLHHSELVVASRLYRGLTDDLIFAGWPAFRIREASEYWQERLPWAGPLPALEETRPYALVSGEGDWQLDWHFDSVRALGPGVQIVVHDEGTAHGRGSDEDEPEGDEIEPYAMVKVDLAPSFGPWDEPLCQAEVSVLAIVPVTMEMGGMAHQTAIVAAGPGATVDYDQEDGMIPAVDAQGQFCRWQTTQVLLDPDPYDAAGRM